MSAAPDWTRLPAETPAQYADFVAWLSLESRPAPRNPNAGPHRWAERAKAYDAHKAPPTGVELLQECQAAMCQILWRETRKLAERSALADYSTISAKELILLAQAVNRSDETLQRLFGGGSPRDLGDLTEEEFAIVRRATQIMTGLG